MAVVTCPNTECGIEVDEWVDFCPACALIAPGGAIAQVLRDHAPRLFCHSCGQTILPPGGKLFTDSLQKGDANRGYLNDGDNCPACQRLNPTTLRWGDQKGFFANLSMLIFRKGYWFWPLCFWWALWKTSCADDHISHAMLAYHVQSMSGLPFKVDAQLSAEWFSVWFLSLACIYLTFSALPTVTQKVKPRTFFFKFVRYIFAYGVGYLYAAGTIFISLIFLFALIPALMSGFLTVVAFLLLTIICCLCIFGYISLEKRWPYVHLAVLKLRGGFWVGLFHRYFGAR